MTSSVVLPTVGYLMAGCPQLATGRLGQLLLIFTVMATKGMNLILKFSLDACMALQTILSCFAFSFVILSMESREMRILIAMQLMF